MSSKQKKAAGRFLSLVLRHRPEEAGITLDKNGWAEISELLPALQNKGLCDTMEDLVDIVETNNKNRYCLNEDQTRIRANQGHSIPVDLELDPIAPPEVLYHGTDISSVPSILKEGIIPGSRLHVHLSVDIITAHKVGRRHGPPAILKVRALDSFDAGNMFYVSRNGVWLTKSVPKHFVEVMFMGEVFPRGRRGARPHQRE